MTRALCRSDQPDPFSNHTLVSSANTLPRAPVDVPLPFPLHPPPRALDPAQSKTPHVMHRCAQHTQVRAPHASSLISSLCLSFAFVMPTGRLVLRYDAFCRPQSTVDTHDWMAVAKKEKGVSSRVVFKSGGRLHFAGTPAENHVKMYSDEVRYEKRNFERAGRAIIGKPINSPSGYSAVSPCRYGDEEGGVFVSRYSTRHGWKRF